jgi:hypothetical protein
MAMLELDRVWITHIDSGLQVAAYSADRSGGRAIPGEVRTYAGGRRRAIIGEGVTGTVAFRLRSVPPADIATLEAWMGDLVRWRDWRGQKFYGAYFAVERQERVRPDQYDLAIRLDEMTFDEEV